MSAPSVETPHPKPPSSIHFALTEDFLEEFKKKTPPFDPLGELVYKRTYARLDNGVQEEWWQTVRRVVEGTYNMQRRWIDKHQLGWRPDKAQRSGQDMFRRIFEMKFLPPGRGLWAMGTELTEKRQLFATLNNCAFVSTEPLKGEKFSKPFTFLMDATLLGVGVGFDTKGVSWEGTIHSLQEKEKSTFIIPDSREGWVHATTLLLDSYFEGTTPFKFDYSKIRPQGSPIHDLGGTAAGGKALEDLHTVLSEMLDKFAGKRVTVTLIADIMNLIACCVAGGGTRRAAEIAFGSPQDDEYVNLKNYKQNPHRAAYGWASNNSVYAEVGMDYSALCDRVCDNGEPGFAWLTNMRQFSRMNEEEGDFKDRRAGGGNPCMEQTLESYELCCLVETFPHRHDSLEDFKHTLKCAYMYAKTVTLGKTHWPETNRVLLRNRRIGTSMSGIAQFITKHGIDVFREWLKQGYDTIQYYDRVYSDWLVIPRSIKTTSVKPSGTVSILAGATPGLHYPLSRFMIRRVRIGRNSPLVGPLRDAGYTIEEDVYDPKNLLVIEFLVDHGKGIRSSKDLSMWEQLSLAAFMQKYWADNQVSCTVTFDPATEGKQLPHALDYFQYQLKGISFLPNLEEGAYPQMPMEAISEETYMERAKNLKIPQLSTKQADKKDMSLEKFCDSTTCYLVRKDN
eukprot:GCRY01003529.1.p1 GENE.GCRY01003529.1~~GCRY01003529.1.p1  ORF type:complete len:677 (+),score=185.55 GCRY01003529.1:218-2248(+)